MYLRYSTPFVIDFVFNDRSKELSELCFVLEIKVDKLKSYNEALDNLSLLYIAKEYFKRELNLRINSTLLINTTKKTTVLYIRFDIL